MLRCQLTQEPLFPLALRLKTPSAHDLSHRFDEVRLWAAQLHSLPHGRVDTRETRNRLTGQNSVPHAVWVDTRDQALAWLGLQAQAQDFAQVVALTRQAQPRLLPWLAQRPLQAVALAREWPRLLQVVAWLQAHPRPGIYLRQVDIAGVHSKFLEDQKAVLMQLLDMALPEQAIDAACVGIYQFEARYGFLRKPTSVRFRMLDARTRLLPGTHAQDITLDADSFAQLDCPVSRVFITENEINYLALPPLPESLAVFGAGYGFEALVRAPWLHRCALFYWGDIDTHGFAILDQLREHFPQVQSVLMNEETLLHFEPLWGFEATPCPRTLHRLTSAEQALYTQLQEHRFGPSLRLEQEHIGFGWVQQALQRVLMQLI